MQIIKALSFKQVVSLIAAIGSMRTVIVQGENGIGKTAMFNALRAMPPLKNHISTLVDCTQLAVGGMWMPALDLEKGISRELPNERFGLSAHNQYGVNGARPVLVAFDEIAKVSRAIQNDIAPLLYERRMGVFRAPEGSIVCGFTNLTIEGLGDAMQPHLLNRIVVVQMRKPTKDEWIQHVAGIPGFSPEVMAFVEQYPQVMDSFLDYESGGKYAGKDMSKHNGYIYNPKSVGVSYASPRSLHAASDVINLCKASGNVDDETLQAALAGTIGATTAEAMGAYLRAGRDICSFERVVAEPKDAPMPENAVAQLTQVFQLVTNTNNKKEAEAVTIYVGRMQEEMQALFCTTISKSSNAGLFVMIKAFQVMLAKHSIFFSNN